MTVRHTAPSRILNSMVPLCDSNEQQRIIASINVIEAKIESLSSALIKKRNIRLGLLRDLITGHIRVNENMLKEFLEQTSVN